MNCIICEQEDAIFRWTDTNSVAVCSHCGMPYNLPRDGEAPTPALKDSGIDIAKAYWKDHKPRWVFAGVYDLGIVRGCHTYSGASGADIEAFDKWYKANYQ